MKEDINTFIFSVVCLGLPVQFVSLASERKLGVVWELYLVAGLKNISYDMKNNLKFPFSRLVFGVLLKEMETLLNFLPLLNYMTL